MKRMKIPLLLWVIVPTLVALLLRAGPADVAMASSSSASWKIVSSPNGNDTTINTFNGVGATSATNAWAVGSYYNNNRGTDLALIEHWDGKTWSIVPTSPAPDSSDNYLTGVKVITANDVWSVGHNNNSDRTLSQTLIQHWDGAQWSVVTSPNKDDGNNKLLAVSGTAGNDVWAVGSFFNTNSGTYQTLTEHWDGSAWGIAYSPIAPSSSDNSLNSVKAIGKNNVWAVGFYRGIDQKTSKTLTLHWDGMQWSVVTSPNKGTNNNQLLVVTSASGKDVWAVGFSFNSSQVRQTLIEHWNGSSWKVVNSSNGGSGDNVLNAVAKVPGTTMAWAVGYYIGVPFGPQLTLTEKYA